MLEIAVCDDDIADLECAVNMLHKIFTSQKIAYHIEQFVSANQMLENISNIDIGILDISMEELNGIKLGRTLKEKFPDALLLFIMPPSAKELRRRLEGRGTESDEVICQRISRAAEEAEGIENYEYIIINDKLDECVKEMHSIINAARRSPQRNKELIAGMRSELDALVKGE